MSNAKKNDYIQMLGPDGIIVGNCSSITPRVDKVHYLWMINNYSFYGAKGDALHSSNFSAATNDECKWYLILKPNSQPGYQKCLRIGLGLHHTSECKVVFARFDVFILDGEQNKVYSRKSNVINKYELGIKADWGFPSFLLKDQLFEYLNNDTLTIYCEATFSEVKDSIDTSAQSITSQLQHRALEDDLSEDLGRLFENQDLTDVVISVKGNKCFQAHKYILAARSPVFAAMFKHNTKENESSQVDITDIDEKVIGEMLHYVYTGKFEHLCHLASDLLRAADKYGMEGLKAKCEDALLKNLTVENAADTLVLADLYCANELKSKTINFIVVKSAEVMNTETWNKIVPSNPHLINEVCRALSRQSAAHFSFLS